MRRLQVAVWIALFLLNSAEAAGRVLRVRAIGEPVTIDWNRASTWVEGFVIRNLMEGLVAVNNKLEPVPALAEKWETSPDFRIYTFHLRRQVKWSDGVPLRAQDFLKSWRRLLAPETNAKYASFLFDIENAEAFHRGLIKDFGQVGIKARDDLTLEVRLKAGVSYWYWIPTFYATYPIREDLMASGSGNWDKPGKLVSIGPFTLSKADPRTITLSKNSFYWGTRGNIDELKISLVSDDAAALKMYMNNEVDFLSKIASLDRNRVKSRPDFKNWPDMRLVHLRMNTASTPTSNVHLRRAIGLAIDRSKLTRLFEGAYKPATSLVPPGMLGFRNKAIEEFDVEKARTELKKSGLVASKLPPLDLLSPSFSDQVILAQFIQEELKRNLGLNVRIHVLEPKRYYSPTLVHTDYAMQINFWGADFPDSDNFFSIFLSNSGLNRYHWTNSEYDKLVIGARSLSTNKERDKTYLNAEHVLLANEVATVPLYYSRISGMVRENIKGFDPGPLDWWVFKDLSIENGAN